MHIPAAERQQESANGSELLDHAVIYRAGAVLAAIITWLRS